MYSILQYKLYDGVPSCTDSFLKSLWNRMVEEGTSYWISYNGTIHNEERFLATVKDPSILFYVVFKEDTPVMITWVTDINGYHGNVHFCSFSHVWGKEIIKIGEFVMGFYGKLFDSLTGYTPATNSLTRRFARCIKFPEICILPNGGYNYHEHCSVDMAMFHVNFKEEIWQKQQ